MSRAAGAASFLTGPAKIFFSEGVGQRALIFDFADSLELAQQLAPWSVVENIPGYCGELLPVVPLADGIFYVAQPGDELLLIGVVGHLGCCLGLPETQTPMPTGLRSNGKKPDRVNRLRTTPQELTVSSLVSPVNLVSYGGIAAK
jgi:hypothetical protein